MKGKSIAIYARDYSTPDRTIQEKRTTDNTPSLIGQSAGSLTDCQFSSTCVAASTHIEYVYILRRFLNSFLLLTLRI
jgi:hypothetical protein